MKYSLIIDTGTSSMRGIVFSNEHRILYTSQHKYFMVFSDGETAEQEAKVYKNCLERIVKECADFAGSHDGEICRIALTSQRSSVLAVNLKGEPMGKIMMWYDKRSQSICDELNEKYGNEIYDTTGMYARPMFSAAKMKWLKVNCPDTYEHAEKLVGIQDYLIFLLTNEWVTDITFASRTNLLDLKTKQWSQRMLEIFEIDEHKLCRLVMPGDKIGKLNAGYVTKGISEETEIFSAGGDQQCSTIGQGIFEHQTIGITNGTASYVTVCGKQRLYDSEKTIHINCGALMESWLMEASNLGTGSVYDWLRNLLYGNDLTGQSLEIMNQELENTEIGADGIIAYPYLAGKGMPEWSNQKTGCILNLKISSKKPDIARAFLEGLAFEVSECYTRMENIAGKPETVQVSGGLSNFPLFNQMLADMLNRTITAVACSETTARGAYIVLMLSCGAITEKDMDSILDKGEPVVYVPNLKNIELYSKLRRKRKNIEKQMPFEEISSQV